MKKYINKILAVMFALALSALLFTGCGNKKNGDASETSGTEITQPELATTRALSEGDIYAINKISGTLPDTYSLIAENDYGRAYRYTQTANIEVGAANYKEDFVSDIEDYAETSCANIKYNNMLYARDTEFEDAVHKEVAGFDAVYRDYLMIQNEFVDENPDSEEDEPVKKEVARHKGRAYFFYSDKDVYYIIFSANEKDWDSQINVFEDFISSVRIDENADNTRL